MKISESGLQTIRHYESCQLTVYRCPAGIWTIGYGHTQGVRPGDIIAEAQAEMSIVTDKWIRICLGIAVILAGASIFALAITPLMYAIRWWQ
jgi:hypothetical protein